MKLKEMILVTGLVLALPMVALADEHRKEEQAEERKEEKTEEGKEEKAEEPEKEKAEEGKEEKAEEPKKEKAEEGKEEKAEEPEKEKAEEGKEEKAEEPKEDKAEEPKEDKAEEASQGRQGRRGRRAQGRPSRRPAEKPRLIARWRACRAKLSIPSFNFARFVDPRTRRGLKQSCRQPQGEQHDNLIYPRLIAGARYAQRCPVEFGVPMETVIAA